MQSQQPSNPSKKSVATIRQVAEMAGVSVATVSRVLSGSEPVSSDLIERVNKAAHTLDYQPNRIARNFRTQKTRIVALVISDIENPFFTSVVRGVERTLRTSGYSLLLANSDENENIEWEHLQNFRAEAVAGIILAPTSSDLKRYQKFIDTDRILVAIDRVPSSLKVDRVTVNNQDGALLAVKHLV